MPRKTRCSARNSSQRLRFLASAAAVAVSDFITVGRSQIEQGASFRLLHLHGDKGRATGPLSRRLSQRRRRLFRLHPRAERGRKYAHRRRLFLRSGRNALRYPPPQAVARKRKQRPVPPAAAGGQMDDDLRLAHTLSEMRNADQRRQVSRGVERLPRPVRSPPEGKIGPCHADSSRPRPAGRALRRSHSRVSHGVSQRAQPELDHDPRLLMQKLFDRVLASIDGLDRALGGDPYLDALRGNANLQKGDLAAAKQWRGRRSSPSPTCRRRTTVPGNFLEGERLC